MVCKTVGWICEQCVCVMHEADGSGRHRRSVSGGKGLWARRSWERNENILEDFVGNVGNVVDNKYSSCYVERRRGGSRMDRRTANPWQLRVNYNNYLLLL